MSDEATLKAIETKFDGYRFRSRTEARWAVFFKRMGMKYEYEPEGYDLDGKCYLPDFWLPELESWFEVKGTGQVGQDELEKVRLLVLHSKRQALIAFGPPRLAQCQLWWLATRWAEKYNQGHICSPVFADLDGLILPLRFAVGEGEQLVLVNVGEGEGEEPAGRGHKFKFTVSNAHLSNAFRAAGHARFEHGECG